MKEKTDKNENIFSSKPLPAINERVKKLIDFYAKGSVKRFSEIIKLSSSQKLNRIFNPDKRNGEYPEVSGNIIISIANMFSEMNPEWLLTGKGEMLKKNEQANTLQEAPNLYKKEEETLLYKMYREKDAEVSTLRELVGALRNEVETLKRENEKLRNEVENFKRETTLTERFIQSSSDAESVRVATAKTR